MKRFYLLGLVLVVTLSACSVDVEGVQNAEYQTSFFDADTNQYFVCDAQATQVTYSFGYAGVIESWTSSLVSGSESGNKEAYVRDLTPSSPGVSVGADGRVSYTFTVTPETAPLAISPEAIVPTGATKLRIVVRGANGTAQTYESPNIPVQTTNCN